MMSFPNLISKLCKSAGLIAFGAVTAFAQFSSGSNGSDGALNFTTPGTIVFDPVALGLNPTGDNIFNFTTINIGPGVTVKLTSSKLREKPVVWLATGAVTIAGTLDLSGANGYPAGSIANLRQPSQPGPGGYAGGVGATDSSPAEPGAGPGGGTVSTGIFALGGAGSYATQGGDTSGPVYGNSLLVPLRGGSGGAGANATSGAGGGAGGGAIQIVSSTSISITGSILANGGTGDTNAQQGGSGSGGAVHLEAPSILGTGTIQAIGATMSVCCGLNNTGGNGWIRIDSTTNTFSGAISPTPNVGPLFNVPLPSAVPTVAITSIGGVAVPAAPTGSFTAPDVTINSGVAVPIVLAATNIPLGTVINLYVSSETGADQVVAATALTGSVANSSATASLVWPLGVSRVFVRAVW